MFALPGQTAADVVADLEHAAELGADQLTTYPLFTFPYTAVGEYLHLAGVKMPDLSTRREHYRAISEWCESHGFERVSVWGFKRGGAPRYSSVTRDGYIGIGPGSGSHLPDGFTLNTFDLAEWEAALARGDSPIALRMPFEGEMNGWWWLYWRFYDTHIPMAALDEALGPDAEKARRWLATIQHAGSGAAQQRLARPDRLGRVLAAPRAEPLRALVREHALDRGAARAVADVHLDIGNRHVTGVRTMDANLETGHAGVGPPSPERRIPLAAEILGYVGGALALGAVVALLTAYWVQIGFFGREAIALGLMLAGLLGGYAIARSDTPAANRLSQFLLFIGRDRCGGGGRLRRLRADTPPVPGHGAQSWSDVMFRNKAADWAVFSAFATAAVVGGAVWWGRRTVLQHLAFGLGVGIGTLLLLAAASRRRSRMGRGCGARRARTRLGGARA